MTSWLFLAGLTRAERLSIQTDSAVVRKVFTYHVVPEHVTTLEVSDGMALETISGPPLRVQIYPKVREAPERRLGHVANSSAGWTGWVVHGHDVRTWRQVIVSSCLSCGT